MINLFYNFYRTDSEERNKELSECLNENLLNPHINTIYTIGEYDIKHPKVKSISYTGIPKFQDVFGFITLISEDLDINIVINSDCYIDHEDSALLNNLKPDEAWCLSRWDVIGDQATHYSELVS